MKTLNAALVAALLLCSAVAFAQPQPKASAAPDGQALLRAAKANDESTVRRLVGQGAPVNEKRNQETALVHAVNNANFSLVKFLVESGAEITDQSIFSADDGNQLRAYKPVLRSIAAYLIATKATQKGLRLNLNEPEAQVKFLDKTRADISDYIKKNWPGMPGTERVIVRFIEIAQNTGDEKGVWAACDVAIVNKTGMYELISKTRLLNDMPEDLEKRVPPLEHAWLYVGDKTSAVSTKFDRKKIQMGNFLLTQNSTGAVSTRYVEYKQ